MSKSEGSSCNADNNACTQNDACHNGACMAGPLMSCSTPLDQCNTAPGTCANGTCSYGMKVDGTVCDLDGSMCTKDVCKSGKCSAGATTPCSAQACMVAGNCIPTTGQCPTPTTAQDGTMCAGGGTCAKGSCCVDNNNACTGKTCGTTTNNCGHTITCQPNSCATSFPNTACQNNLCACPSGVAQLGCSTATAPACGLWSFESGGVEGWRVSDINGAWDGKPLAPSPSNYSIGTHSLAVGYDAMNQPGFGLAVDVPFCATSLTGRTVSAHVHLVGIPIPPNFFVGLFAESAKGELSIFEQYSTPSPDFILGRTLTADILVSSGAAATDTWTSLRLWLNDSDSPSGWKGTIYIDGVQIQ